MKVIDKISDGTIELKLCHNRTALCIHDTGIFPSAGCLQREDLDPSFPHLFSQLYLVKKV